MSRHEMVPEHKSASIEDGPGESEGAIQCVGTVKWFDATRGFGFIVSDEMEGDILVHFSVLKEHDRRSLPEGAVVECLVVEQERGLQARKVLSIDLSQAIVPDTGRASSARSGCPCGGGIFTHIVPMTATASSNAPSRANA